MNLEEIKQLIDVVELVGYTACEFADETQLVVRVTALLQKLTETLRPLGALGMKVWTWSNESTIDFYIERHKRFKEAGMSERVLVACLTDCQLRDKVLAHAIGNVLRNSFEKLAETQASGLASKRLESLRKALGR